MQLQLPAMEKTLELNDKWYFTCFGKQGEVQYFIGVQLDGSEHIEPLKNAIPEDTVKESEKLVSTFFTFFFFLYFLFLYSALEFLFRIKLIYTVYDFYF